MPTVFVTSPDGKETAIKADAGVSLMESLVENDQPIAAICGGCKSCATCHVFVEGDWYGKFPAPDQEELDLLQDDYHYRQGSSRLSCQLEVKADMEGLKIAIAPSA